MGLLDFINTPQGVGLLSAVAGYAANARRGQPINSIGRGALAGLQGYSQFNQDAMQQKQQAVDNEIRRRQQELLAFDYDTRRKKMEAEAADDQNAGKFFEAMFTEAGYDPNKGGFMQVSSTPQPIQASPIPYPGEAEGVKLIQDDLSYTPPPPPKPANPFDDVYKELGWTPGRIKFFQTQLKASPESAMKDLRSAYIEMDRANRKGRVEARDVMAKEKAMAEAMNMTLGEYLSKVKYREQGPAAVVYNYGSPVAATDPNTGDPVFLRFPKDSGPPIAVPGYTPPEKPTEAEAKSATFYQQMDSASRSVDDVEKTFDPSKFTSQVGIGMAGGITNPLASDSAQKYRQAQEQWSEAFLRIKTGAAATQDEVDRNIRTFFPQVGDSKAVVEQKRLARKKAEQDVKAMGGTATRRIEREQSRPQQPASGVRRYNPATGRIE